jgi:hypothetical protein
MEMQPTRSDERKHLKVSRAAVTALSVTRSRPSKSNSSSAAETAASAADDSGKTSLKSVGENRLHGAEGAAIAALQSGADLPTEEITDSPRITDGVREVMGVV